MKRLFTIIAVAMVCIGFTAIGSEAGVKKIRPDQLTLVNPDYSHFQYPSHISSNSASDICSWTAVVKLPAGKRITKLIYYHRGMNSGVSDHTEVALRRVKMGEAVTELAKVECNDRTDTIIRQETTNILFPRIKSDYTYYVYAVSFDSTSFIHGIKIVYED